MRSESFENLSSKEQLESVLIDSLKKLGATVENDRINIRGSHIVQFLFENGVTTVRIVFGDSSGADLVIANMTTLPVEEKGKGHGSQILSQLIALAKESGMKNIRAVQIEKLNQNFWEENGFKKVENPNPGNDYIYQGTEK